MDIIYPDVSFYQDDDETPQQIDFSKMREKTEHVIIRAGQNTWIDPDFEYNWREAKKAGLKRGSYWYYDSRVEPEAQARKWAAALNGDFGEGPLFVDLEEKYGGAWSGWKKWYAFIEYVKRHIPEKKNHIVIYTGYYYWQEHTGTIDNATQAYFASHPLWLAWYGTSADKLKIPGAWDKISLWQYTETGDGLSYGVESKGIDLNKHIGNNLDWFWGAEEPTEEPVEDAPEVRTGKVLIDDLRVRGETDGHAIGSLRKGVTVNIEDDTLSEHGDTMYKISAWIYGTFSGNELVSLANLPDELVEEPEEEPVEEPKEEQVFWRVKHDQEQGSFWLAKESGTDRNGFPEVVVLDTHVVKMTKAIQWMCFDLLTFGMTQYDEAKAKKQYPKVYWCHRAFNNGKGFNCDRHGPYADFVNNKNTGSPLPSFDKVRVCGGATLKGEVVDDMLKVETLRGAMPIEELITKPWLYFEAVSAGDTIVQFPQAAPGDRVLIPLIANKDVFIPLSMLEKVNEIADPYYVP